MTYAPQILLATPVADSVLTSVHIVYTYITVSALLYD